MDRVELENLDRETLVVRAQAAGIRRARILTRPELMDELLRLDLTVDASQLRRSRGFFGRARDLVARVVERGLHLPDAADRIRTLALDLVPPGAAHAEPQAMPTVTLAEIYAAQGHRARAVETLRRVLEREPDHAAASMLLERLQDETYIPPEPKLPPEFELEPDAHPNDEPETITHEFVEVEAAAIAALPQREAETSSDVADHCIAIPVPSDAAGSRMYARWSASTATLRAVREASPRGRLVVRALIITPTWDGPKTEIRDFDVDLASNEPDLTLVALPEPSVVRVAVGWLDNSAFVPIAHSPPLDFGHDASVVRWTPYGWIPVASDGADAVSLARAIRGSRTALPFAQTTFQSTSSG